MLSLRELSPVMLLVLLVFYPVSLSAGWPVDGLPVCTLDALAQGNIVSLESGDGGVIFVWRDHRYSDYDIFAQKVDREGNLLWTIDGVPVCTMSGDQILPCAVSDGAGGVIIAWVDFRGGPSDIYAQRMDANGTRMWLLSGSAICTAANDQNYPVITTDGAGGAIIAWQDDRSGVYDRDIYVRRVDLDGTVYWTVWGEPVCTNAATKMNLQIASFSNGGAYIAWSDNRNGNYDIFCECVYSNGTMENGAGGYAVCDDPATQSYPHLIKDSSSTVVVAWQDHRNASAELYAQRLYLLSDRWASNGIQVATSVNAQELSAVKDEEDYIVFSWIDLEDDIYGIYAQRLHMNGIPVWPMSGISVHENISNLLDQMIISDDNGGTIVLWREFNSIVSRFKAQRLDSDGNSLWNTDGVTVCDIPDSQRDCVAVRDEEGGAIVAWRDGRLGYNSIYAQKLDRHGFFGSPEPLINEVTDVPLDQGGKVEITWDASYLDPYPKQEITYYSIWKSLSPASAMMMENDIEYTDLQAINLNTDNLNADSRSGIPFGIIVRRETVGAATYYWELLETQAAQYYEGYSKVLDTDFTSLETAFTYSYYQVAAHTSDPLVVWTSQPDSGYSLDNLAPAAPVGLEGEQEYSPEGMDLVWNSNPEEDLSHYVIYRGIYPTFAPDASSYLTSAYDTMYFDGGWSWEDGYVYKVSAIDIHGNESGYALLLPDQVTGDDPPTPARSDYISQNWPNPFNPSTTIQFGLKESGHVRLSIYDTSGRLVSELMNSSLPAGDYSKTWNGTNSSGQHVSSGVYFYRIDAGDFSMKKKMILLR